MVLKPAIVSRISTAFRESMRTALFARTILMRNRKPIVSFTFDDFPRSSVINGARLLKENRARGTFYVTGSYCGRIVDDVRQYCAEDVVELVRAGHEIGCHTFTHPRVSKLSAAALKEEIEVNAAFLDRLLPGAELQTFAYPFGDVSFTATRQLQSTFAGCRGSEPGLNVGRADLGRLRSIRLYDRLLGREDVSDLIKQAMIRTAWLIFYTHDVDPTPSSFGCTPSLFEHALKSAISAGAEVLPVAAAIKAVTTL
jgi:peptidoglycan/xylan/chitin deacetylase (PgdA/CDA1 family)